MSPALPRDFPETILSLKVKCVFSVPLASPKGNAKRMIVSQTDDSSAVMLES